WRHIDRTWSDPSGGAQLGRSFTAGADRLFIPSTGDRPGPGALHLVTPCARPWLARRFVALPALRRGRLHRVDQPDLPHSALNVLLRFRMGPVDRCVALCAGIQCLIDDLSRHDHFVRRCGPWTWPWIAARHVPAAVDRCTSVLWTTCAIERKKHHVLLG